jgi:hypothetical protein
MQNIRLPRDFSLTGYAMYLVSKSDFILPPTHA